jgi:hypothetical protein
LHNQRAISTGRAVASQIFDAKRYVFLDNFVLFFTNSFIEGNQKMIKILGHELLCVNDAA